LKRSDSKREESKPENQKLGFRDKLENEFDSDKIPNDLLRFLGEKIEEDERIKTPQKSGRNGVGLERIWRRKGDAAWQLGLCPDCRLKVRDDTVAGRKNRLFRLPISLLGLTEREGDQTDFGEREEGRPAAAGLIGPVWPRGERKSWAEIGPTT
jgi:hypothetical protein